MWRFALLLSVMVLAAGCVATEPKAETVSASQEDVKRAEKTLERCESEIAIKDRQITELQQALAEIQRATGKSSNSGEENDIEDLRRLNRQAAELAAKIDKLGHEIKATSKEAQEAAARLLLEAKCFERDNPTEAKSIVAAKYKAVVERYPLTEAAKEAGKRYEELSK